MRVLVTGAAGQLGAVVVGRFRHDGHDVVAARRSELDITDHADVMRVTAAFRPEVIVNCAAFNDVDAAEGRYQEAFDANAFSVRSLARAATRLGAILMHYSTDFVFAGDRERVHSEDDPAAPQSVYAWSKYLGERFAAGAPRHYVFRVESLFGGPAARSSIDRIIRNLQSGAEARVFVDRVVSPSYVEDVADASLEAIRAAIPFGLYHCVNGGHTTWLELGQEIARRIGADEQLLIGVKVADVSLKARRPQFAALSNARLAATGIALPSWQAAIARYLVVDAGRPRP